MRSPARRLTQALRGSHLSNTTSSNAGVLQKWRFKQRVQLAVLDKPCCRKRRRAHQTSSVRQVVPHGHNITSDTTTNYQITNNTNNSNTNNTNNTSNTNNTNNTSNTNNTNTTTTTTTTTTTNDNDNTKNDSNNNNTTNDNSNSTTNNIEM